MWTVVLRYFFQNLLYSRIHIEALLESLREILDSRNNFTHLLTSISSYLNRLLNFWSTLTHRKELFFSNRRPTLAGGHLHRSGLVEWNILDHLTSFSHGKLKKKKLCKTGNYTIKVGKLRTLWKNLWPCTTILRL